MSFNLGLSINSRNRKLTSESDETNSDTIFQSTRKPWGGLKRHRVQIEGYHMFEIPKYVRPCLTNVDRPQASHLLPHVTFLTAFRAPLDIFIGAITRRGVKWRSKDADRLWWFLNWQIFNWWTKWTKPLKWRFLNWRFLNWWSLYPEGST